MGGMWIVALEQSLRRKRNDRKREVPPDPEGSDSDRSSFVAFDSLLAGGRFRPFGNRHTDFPSAPLGRYGKLWGLVHGNIFGAYPDENRFQGYAAFGGGGKT